LILQARVNPSYQPLILFRRGPKTPICQGNPTSSPWDCNQREYAQFNIIYSSKLQLPDFEHMQQQAASLTFPEPTLRPAWGKIKYSLSFPVTTKPYQHPRLTKIKVGFATYADHLRVVEAWNAADARRTT
jgi:hypothetical protein